METEIIKINKGNNLGGIRLNATSIGTVLTINIKVKRRELIS